MLDAAYRLAHVSSALDRGAVVRPLGLVLLDKRLPGTETAATPQPRVERLQPLRRVPNEQQERHVTQVGFDVVADLRLVVHPRGRIDLVLGQPPVEQGAHRRLGPSHLQRVRLGEQPRPGPLGVLHRGTLGTLAAGLLDRDAFDEHDPISRGRILARRHPHLQAPAHPPDAAPLTPFGGLDAGRHGTEASTARG